MGFFEGSGFTFNEATHEVVDFEGMRGSEQAPKRKELAAVVVESEAKRYRTEVLLSRRKWRDIVSSHDLN